MMILKDDDSDTDDSDNDDNYGDDNDDIKR